MGLLALGFPARRLGLSGHPALLGVPGALGPHLVGSSSSQPAPLLSNSASSFFGASFAWGFPCEPPTGSGLPLLLFSPPRALSPWASQFLGVPPTILGHPSPLQASACEHPTFLLAPQAFLLSGLCKMGLAHHHSAAARVPPLWTGLPRCGPPFSLPFGLGLSRSQPCPLWGLCSEPRPQIWYLCISVFHLSKSHGEAAWQAVGSLAELCLGSGAASCQPQL